MRCRAILGSHFFIWSEFAMFSNIDALLFSMETYITKLEVSRFTESTSLLEKLKYSLEKIKQVDEKAVLDAVEKHYVPE